MCDNLELNLKWLMKIITIKRNDWTYIRFRLSFALAWSNFWLFHRDDEYAGRKEPSCFFVVEVFCFHCKWHQRRFKIKLYHYLTKNQASFLTGTGFTAFSSKFVDLSNEYLGSQQWSVAPLVRHLPLTHLNHPIAWRGEFKCTARRIVI